MKINATNKPIRVFFSYAHEDEKMRGEIAKRLSLLKEEGVIASWHDGEIKPGSSWEPEIVRNLAAARIILLLVSPDFLASGYCYRKEAKAALARHKLRKVCVIPIILRPCDWKHTELRELQALPTDAREVTRWRSKDSAYQNIIEGIRQAMDDLKAGVSPSYGSSETTEPQIPPSATGKKKPRLTKKPSPKIGGGNHLAAYSLQWIGSRRKRALTKNWKGNVTPLVRFPSAPKSIDVAFQFKPGWKIVRGIHYFKSFKPGLKGMIINRFEGGFYNDHVLRLDYVHTDRSRFGFGVILLWLTGDASVMNGFIIGLSSNFDQLFASKVSLTPISD